MRLVGLLSQGSPLARERRKVHLRSPGLLPRGYFAKQPALRVRGRRLLSRVQVGREEVPRVPPTRAARWTIRMARLRLRRPVLPGGCVLHAVRGLRMRGERCCHRFQKSPDNRCVHRRQLVPWTDLRRRPEPAVHRQRQLSGSTFCNPLGFCQSFASCTSNLVAKRTFAMSPPCCIPGGRTHLDVHCQLGNITTLSLVCGPAARRQRLRWDSCVSGQCRFSSRRHLHP
jgi:hypothetical protein